MFLFGLFLLGYWILRLWLASFSGVHPDEAYYWVWSLNPSLGYYDHPPMIAWIISLSREMASWLPIQFDEQNSLANTQLGLRFLPYFLSCVVTPWLMGWSIQKVQREPLRVTQMFALMSSMTFVFGPIVVTPDTPLFAAWALALALLIALIRGHEQNIFPGDQTRFSLKISIALGITLAFAAYSKYSAILLAVSLLITGLGLWNSIVAGTLSLILVAPYVIWNFSGEAQSQSSGMLFQMQYGLNPLSAPIRWSRVAELWGAQLFFWGPLIFLGAFGFLLSSARRLFSSERRSTLTGTLFIWAFLPLLFFSITGLRRAPEANWPLMGCIAASVLTISRMYTHGFWLVLTTFTNSLFLIGAAVVFFKPSALISLLPENKYPKLVKQLNKDPRFFEFQHWDQLRSSLFEATLNTQEPIVVESYQKLSALLFVDDAVPENEKLSSRLKIWQNSRKSEYHTKAKYTFDESKPHWLLLRQKTKRPSYCKHYQQLFRGENPTEINSLYKCN